MSAKAVYLQANEKLVCLTVRASQKISDLIKRENRGDYLRIRITGGGCNGLSYNMKFVEEGKSGDLLVKSHNTQILVDSKTALYLREPP